VPGAEIYEFGEFTLDVSERRLARRGKPLKLSPKTYQLLLTLIRRAGKLVTKRELLEIVWPECFVSEGIVAVHVSALRRVLDGAKGGTRHIETVPRAGYRFIASVTRGNGNSRFALSARDPRKPEVYQLFGRGRAHLLSYSLRETPNAIAAFKAAIDLDPSYSAAHAGLALAHCAQAYQRLAPPSEAYHAARASALRALAMDHSSADAQTALGAVLMFSDWNWTGARISLEHALDINPQHTEAYLLLGQLMEALGDLDRGLDLKQRALERDPLSPLVHLQISLSFWHQRRYGDAIEWANKTVELDPRHPHAREHLAGAYLKMGDFDAYFSENIEHARLHGVPAEALDPLKQAYSENGRAGIINLILKRAELYPQSFPAIQLAIFRGDAGDFDRAFLHLNHAIEARDPGLLHLAVAPQWDSLRSDPRFPECLARMGLTPTNS